MDIREVAKRAKVSTATVGMKAFHELHNLNPPTAVLCSNDMTAIGLMREAYEQNVRAP